MGQRQIKLARTLSDGFLSEIRKTLRAGAPGIKFKAIHHVHDKPIQVLVQVDGQRLEIGEGWTFVATNQPETKNNGIYTVKVVRGDGR